MIRPSAISGSRLKLNPPLEVLRRSHHCQINCSAGPYLPHHMT